MNRHKQKEKKKGPTKNKEQNEEPLESFQVFWRNRQYSEQGKSDSFFLSIVNIRIEIFFTET